MLSRFAKLFLAVTTILFLVTTLNFIHPKALSYFDPITGQRFEEGGSEQGSPFPADGSHIAVDAIHGGVIMPKLGNATAKAELGRATWKFLHTMTLRYPEHPTKDERNALGSFFFLASRLYPCGECAEEFQQLLKKYPPQTSSRRAASLWLCHLHNQVNERLKKPAFDCTRLSEEYDCGCGDDPEKTSKEESNGSTIKADDSTQDDLTGIEMIKGGRICSVSAICLHLGLLFETTSVG